MVAQPLCPHCDQPFARAAAEGISCLRCGGCGGLWFEREPFKEIIERGLARPAAEAPLHLAKRQGVLLQPDDPGHRCPQCGATLRHLNYGYNSNVIIDQCQSCGGCFLDPGELTQLIAFCRNHPQLQELGQALAEHEAAVVAADLGVTAKTADSAGWPALPRPALPDLDQILNRSVQPIFAVALLLISVALELIFHRFRPPAPETLFGFWPSPALLPDRSLRSFLLSFLLHDGYLQLGTNMLMLLLFGPALEEIFGHLHFLLLYLTCNLAAAALQLGCGGAAGLPLIGTSGAIIGLIGAYLAIDPKAPLPMYWRGRMVEVPVLALPLIWFGSQLLNFFGLPLIGQGTFLSWWAQAGGLAAGLLYGLFFRWRKLNPQRVE